MSGFESIDYFFKDANKLVTIINSMDTHAEDLKLKLIRELYEKDIKITKKFKLHVDTLEEVMYKYDIGFIRFVFSNVRKVDIKNIDLDIPCTCNKCDWREEFPEQFNILDVLLDRGIILDMDYPKILENKLKVVKNGLLK